MQLLKVLWFLVIQITVKNFIETKKIVKKLDVYTKKMVYVNYRVLVLYEERWNTDKDFLDHYNVMLKKDIKKKLMPLQDYNVRIEIDLY